jgi:hypothetical protein
LDAVLTTAFVASLLEAGALELDAGAVAELWLLELLPHAARVNDAARVGRRYFSVGRIASPLT